MEKIAVVSLSGGMDSTTLVLYYLSKGYYVHCLTFDYGQKHKYEIQMAKDFLSYISGLSPEHTIIDLTSFSSLLDSALIKGSGRAIPLGHYSEESMKQTVVPNRNKIFSSICQAIALSYQTRYPKSIVVIGLGIHAGDHEIYPDCRAVWREADQLTFKLGNWEADNIMFDAPFQTFDKCRILREGEYLCSQLEISFDEVYKRTLTSYRPFIAETIYSDCYSGSSVERIEAFIQLGRPDPLPYIDKNLKPVTWEEVVNIVKPILGNKKK